MTQHSDTISTLNTLIATTIDSVTGYENSAKDVDTKHQYPCDYTLANIICVAATDSELLLRFTVARTWYDPALRSFTKNSQLRGDSAPAAEPRSRRGRRAPGRDHL